MECLRETLSKTRERLEQEKRLNAAIKQKKVYSSMCTVQCSGHSYSVRTMRRLHCKNTFHTGRPRVGIPVHGAPNGLRWSSYPACAVDVLACTVPRLKVFVMNVHECSIDVADISSGKWTSWSSEWLAKTSVYSRLWEPVGTLLWLYH